MQVTCSVPFFRVCTKRWVMVSDMISKWRLWKLVGCCKLSLYANESCGGHAIFIFGNDWNDALSSSHFWQWCNLSQIKDFDFRLFIYTYSINSETIVEYDIKSKYSRTSLFRTRLIRSPCYFEGRSNALGFTLPLYVSPVISKPRYFELFSFPLGLRNSGVRLYLEEYSTIDKVGRLINSEKLLARKSCFV